MTPKDGTTPDGDSGKRCDSHPSIQYTIEPDESISCTIIRAVAAATGVSPERLEPLYNVINPDALDRLFKMPSETPRCSQETAVSFQYEGYLVTVQNHRQIILSSQETVSP